ERGVASQPRLVYGAGAEGSGRGGQRVLVGGYGPPAEPVDRTAGEGVLDEGPGLVDLGRVGVEEKEDADGQAVLGPQVPGLVELEALGLFLEEGLRDLARQASAVAGVAADAAAMLEGFESCQGCPHDFRRGLAVFGRHAADAAGVTAHVVRVQELPGANQR